jgi:predicted nucleic acid-binding Zn ribbon protein
LSYVTEEYTANSGEKEGSDSSNSRKTSRDRDMITYPKAKKEPRRLGNFLPQVLQGLGLKTGIDQHQALIIWDKVVGQTIAAHTKPGWIDHGILWVFVQDSIWHQELEFMKSQILERLNQQLEHGKMRGIKFIQKGRQWSTRQKKSKY